jgi:murein L,D-transpeptidase YafK
MKIAKAKQIIIIIITIFGFSLVPLDYSNTFCKTERTNVVADKVLIEKSQRHLKLFHSGKLIKSYKVALGKNPNGQKVQEADGRTPEGNYFIDGRKSNSAFHLALHISYPNAVDKARAESLGVKPGGNIMIHGIKNGLGWLGSLHRLSDWTQGCIAVKDSEIEEIWNLVPNGTLVEIVP